MVQPAQYLVQSMVAQCCVSQIISDDVENVVGADGTGVALDNWSKFSGMYPFFEELHGRT
jgi:hypothetical protein